MRNPERVLNTLCQHSKDSDYKYERLYRILFNEEMFFVAYQRIYAKPGNMTPGSDGQTIDGMSIQRIESLIEKLKNESYKPKPAKRVYIPKKNGKKRPLGLPSIEDKLVQEVVKMILEAIYEDSFEDTSHGFRPYRGCHTALTSIQRSFTGAKWFVEGDIKGFFDNIDHEVMIAILWERISDERFLRLIRKFLNAGYMENQKYNHTYSGTPQGGIISPMLANIYLDKFDKYMKKYIQKFDKGTKRHINPAYNSLHSRIVYYSKRLERASDPAVKAQLLEKVKALRYEKLHTPNSLQMDENYRRMKYVRYADDFLIGVIGSKADCERIKADITQYMRDTLRLELSAEKTLITHAEENAKFLGFDITVNNGTATKRNCLGRLRRAFTGKVRLMLNIETVKKKLTEFDAVKFMHEDGKDVWKPKSRPKMIGMKPEDMLAQYNTEVRGFYNYYRIANNISSTGSSFGHIMKYSFYMTLGRKLNLHTGQVIRKFSKDGKFVVNYTDSKGREKSRTFYDEGFKRREGFKNNYMDNLPNTVYVPKGTLADRLKAETCELCGESGPVVMHHVRKLTTIKGDTEWGKRMLRNHRKTLVVCEECYAKIKGHEHC